MLRTLGGAIVAVALTAAAPTSHGADVVVTQFGAAFAGSPFGIAVDGGYFRRAGVDITGVLPGAGGGSSVRNVIASGVGYGEVVVSAAVAAIEEGIDIRIVNIGARSVADIAMVVMPESPIRSLKDLAGRKIGVSNPKSLSDIVAVLMVEKAGLRDEQVQRIPVGSLGGALTALEQGAVDVATALPVVWAARANKYRIILNVKDDLPPMAQSVGIATGELMREKPEQLRAILTARRTAVDFMNSHPAETAAMLEKYFDKVPREVLAHIVGVLVADRHWSPGRIEIDRLETMAHGLRRVGALKRDVDWSKIVDRSFLPEDLRN